MQLSIYLLIALAALSQISQTIYTLALPEIATSLHTNNELVEATLFLYFIGFAMGIVLWGILSDVWGRRKVMLAGVLCFIVASAGCMLSHQIEVLLIWSLLQAFGVSVGSVTTQTIVRDVYTGSERVKLFAVLSVAMSFSPALGPIMGGFLSEWMGWRSNFLFLGVMGCLCFLWCWRTLPETCSTDVVRPSIHEVMRLMRSMLSSKALLGHVLLIAATNGVIFGFYQEAPFVYIDYLQIHPSYYSLIGILVASATIVAAWISYTLSDRYSAESILFAGSYLAIGSSALYIATVWTGILSEGILGIALSVIALFFIFLGVGLVIPSSLSMALKPYQQVVGTAGSLFGGIYCVVLTAFTALLSVLHDGSPLPLPLFIGGLSLLLWFGARMVTAPIPMETVETA
jgi:Bcr/CflA subfamily drug resistance transporter